MIKQSIFRQYDIRGTVKEELNEQCVKLIGYYLGLEIIKRSVKNPYVVVGYDARTHSTLLFDYLVSGFNKAHVNVLGMGMVSTGVNYFASYKQFDKISPNASVMITGSHNPKEYNGFKITINNIPFFGQDIYTLRNKIIENKDLNIENNITYKKIDAKKIYVNYMLKEFKHLKGFNTPFAIDCGNGVANTVLCEILDKLQLNYKGLYCKPDGTFPNHHPDPSEEENLMDLKNLLKGDINFGFAYDGDADRIAFLTKQYNVKGDILAILFAKTMNNPMVIGEVKCTQVMYDMINKFGKAIMYKTGHSNLKIKLKELNAHLAAEVSGHMFFNDKFFGFDDAIYATFRILELIKNGMDINKEIKNLPKTFSTEEIKIKTTEEEKFILIDKIKEILKSPPLNFPKIIELIDIDGVRIKFQDGWALVRASNTTPILVTRFESTNKNNILIYKNAINDLIRLAKKV